MSILDCGDNSCLFAPAEARGGMRTNGGCTCLRELERTDRDLARKIRGTVFDLNGRLHDAYAMLGGVPPRTLKPMSQAEALAFFDAIKTGRAIVAAAKEPKP